MVGNWNVDVTVGAMPQKVATAMGKLSETLLGAEYEAIAYLGSQVVNGTNHAVLAEQTVTTGRDTKNVVVLIFNEKPNEIDLTLVSIERVVEGGLPMGGTVIDVQTEIPAEIQEVWDAAFEGYVGYSLSPIAYLGSQVTKGTTYIFAVEATPVVAEPTKQAMIIAINPMTKAISFADLLASKEDDLCGYSFTWLKKGLGAPLGEWP